MIRRARGRGKRDRGCGGGLRPGGLFVCETVSSQLLSHPLRTRGRRLPWASVPELRLERQAILWKSRAKR
jgi:hypothetical protein